MKEFAEINDSLRRVYWWVGLQAFTLSTLQRPKTSVLDGAIRDNYLWSWFRKSQDEFQDGIWYHKDDSIIHKEIGQGYISEINDVAWSGYDLHGWFFPWDKEEDLSWFEEVAFGSVQLQKQQCR